MIVDLLFVFVLAFYEGCPGILELCKRLFGCLPLDQFVKIPGHTWSSLTAINQISPFDYRSPINIT